MSEIRLSYDPTADVLSIGLNQPPARAGATHSVIAGDADGNGNDGTVSAQVSSIFPPFQDLPDFGGSEFMGAFLDLNQDGYADIVAGYSGTDPRSPKQYQVAEAIVNTNAPPAAPDFGTQLPQFTGNVYKVNSPLHPNLEFSIDRFSELYTQETGQTLTPETLLGIGAFGGSDQDDGISEAFFPQAPFNWGDTIVPPPVCPPPPPPPVIPPVSPPVLVNPHENHHVNTAHPTDVRVSVLGTSGFNVQMIDPSTVRLGGAAPVTSFFRKVNGDQFLDVTYVFKGTDIVLPPGITNATITGSLTNGQKFESSVRIFNRDASFYSPTEVAQAQARQAANPGRLQTPISVIQRRAIRNGAILGASAQVGVAPAALQVPRGPAAFQGRGNRVAQALPTGPAASSQVVSIRRRQPVVATAVGGGISAQLQSSMNAYADSHAGMHSGDVSQSSS